MDGDPRRVAMEALRGRWRVPERRRMEGLEGRLAVIDRRRFFLWIMSVSNCQFGSLPIHSLLCFNDDADDAIPYGPSTRNYTSGAEKRKGSAAGPSSLRVLAQVAETGRTANSGEPISHRQAVCGISNGTRKKEREKPVRAPCPLLTKSLPLQCWKQPSALRVCRSWDIGCSCIGALRKIGRSTIVVGNLRKLALIEFIELLRRHSSSTGSTVRTCGALEVVNCRSARTQAKASGPGLSSAKARPRRSAASSSFEHRLRAIRGLRIVADDSVLFCLFCLFCLMLFVEQIN